jgi:hypothetical protein
MPPDDRISRLLNALSGGLSQEKLESLSSEFNSLAQDRAETLVFFVLQNVCQRLGSLNHQLSNINRLCSSFTLLNSDFLVTFDRMK